MRSTYGRSDGRGWGRIRKADQAPLSAANRHSAHGLRTSVDGIRRVMAGGMALRLSALPTARLHRPEATGECDCRGQEDEIADQ
jgi:hypothetical protein